MTMMPRAFVLTVCIPMAVLLLALGLSPDSNAQGVAVIIGSVVAVLSGVIVCTAGTERERSYAGMTFVAALWSGMLIAIARLVML